MSHAVVAEDILVADVVEVIDGTSEQNDNNNNNICNVVEDLHVADVIDGNSEIRIDIGEDNRIHPPVTCDGQVNITARPGDSVRVYKKPHRLELIHPVEHNFYASCRDKLRWSNSLVE